MVMDNESAAYYCVEMALTVSVSTGDYCRLLSTLLFNLLSFSRLTQRAILAIGGSSSFTFHTIDTRFSTSVKKK